MSLLNTRLCELLGTEDLLEVQVIQELWSGCGQVARVRWMGGLGQAERGEGEPGCAVVKHVKMPSEIDHPRGWNTDRSAKRKAESYAVETRWYGEWSGRCPAACRVPRCLGFAEWDDERLLFMEDVDASGYPRRVTGVAGATLDELDACVRWLAAFHGTFMGERPKGLWDKGTYWQLGTRPDEWARMADGALKRSAAAIDHALDASPFQTVVHGDAKLANFCFPEAGAANDGGVAAVDFQYVGGGCAMKDLAYLVGGCLDAEECFREEDRVLGVYFEALGAALQEREAAVDRAALEADWRRLYPFAWADFQRFLVGWSPGHWKISPYSEHMTRRALEMCGA
ncbi:phosphotransferase family protein [Algisphaera agarilytica]|uniref:Aminoglycoside phosphotransferase (APT) family kinase protein n=1 Tax=Algisphaera agarilytica TaxID=1385975 RepID=A0A7X0LK22_9BACT|nr:phosphotransferase [Algisphaera agarilytica]MBB6429374.1 aminoglycoside phosphotransferase (APT) family kinase protein [Algisphaera agarilytica]